MIFVVSLFGVWIIGKYNSFNIFFVESGKLLKEGEEDQSLSHLQQFLLIM
jgi:hypothetical protein